MKNIFLFFVLTVIMGHGFSQSRVNYFQDTIINKSKIMRPSFGVTITPYLVNKMNVRPYSGSYRLKTSYQFGFEAGPDYYINISRNYKVKVGLHEGGAIRNFKLFISKYDFNPNLKFDVNENDRWTSEWFFYTSFPICFEKWILNSNNSYWDFAVGGNIRLYPFRNVREDIDLEYPDVNGNNVKVLMIHELTDNKRAWIDYNISAGLVSLLKDKNYLRFNLVANFSNKNIVNESYQINVSGKPQSIGNCTVNLSYLGLSCDYIFGRTKGIHKHA